MNDGGSPSFDHLVHQAEGILVARYDLPLPEAMGLLRAWAAEEGVSVLEVARGVVDTLVETREDGHRGG
jgi:AmiR/NasT family two-component response regulator